MRGWPFIELAKTRDFVRYDLISSMHFSTADPIQKLQFFNESGEWVASSRLVRDESPYIRDAYLNLVKFLKISWWRESHHSLDFVQVYLKCSVSDDETQQFS